MRWPDHQVADSQAATGALCAGIGWLWGAAAPCRVYSGDFGLNNYGGGVISAAAFER